ncbi:MAG: spondin domain-containing protein [Actinomycetota bacterium]
MSTSPDGTSADATVDTSTDATITDRRSRRRTGRLAALALAGATLAGGAVATTSVVDADGHGYQPSGPTFTYRITVENHTDAQPLSPVGTVIHDRRTDVWSRGEPASAAVAAIAEDAALPVFVDTYAQTPGVRSAFAGGGGPIGPGASASFEFEASPRDRVSLVSMLVNTNDAFTGLDSVRLGRQTQKFEVIAYDSGTEVNNENAGFIPGPVGGNAGVRDPEGNVITVHPGIVGVDGGIDPAVYDWDDPVATITIERIRN